MLNAAASDKIFQDIDWKLFSTLKESSGDFWIKMDTGVSEIQVTMQLCMLPFCFIEDTDAEFLFHIPQWNREN